MRSHCCAPFSRRAQTIIESWRSRSSLVFAIAAVECPGCRKQIIKALRQAIPNMTSRSWWPSRGSRTTRPCRANAEPLAAPGQSRIGAKINGRGRAKTEACSAHACIPKCILGCYRRWSRPTPGPARRRLVSARPAIASAFPHNSHVHFPATHSA